MTDYNLPVNYEVLSWQERAAVRAQYIKEQDNNCYWCANSLSLGPPTSIMKKSLDMTMFPPNFLDHPIHLQHDHDNGLTEGAVHARCNAVMWQYHGR